MICLEEDLSQSFFDASHHSDKVDHIMCVLYFIQIRLGLFLQNMDYYSTFWEIFLQWVRSSDTFFILHFLRVTMPTIKKQR